jgi:hypothetical protein
MGPALPLALSVAYPPAPISTTIVSSTLASDFLELTVFPVPAYSTEDPDFHLSSASWLLSQLDDFKNMPIPLPCETALPSAVIFGDSEVTRPYTPSHPSFPTPVAFGDPLEVGGWKDRRPSWMVAVPQVVPLKFTTRVCVTIPFEFIFIR